MACIYIGLGSNLGNREYYLHKAIELINERIGNITVRSNFLNSEPWGYLSTHSYLNACLAAETTLKPEDCLSVLKGIEVELGRLKTTSGSYEDRVIDLDILFYEDKVLLSEELSIPHPFIQDRLFVLIPLAEIAPNFIHPVFKKSVGELLKAFNEQS